LAAATSEPFHEETEGGDGIGQAASAAERNAPGAEIRSWSVHRPEDPPVHGGSLTSYHPQMKQGKPEGCMAVLSRYPALKWTSRAILKHHPVLIWN
jgi:hypothetical protein